MRRGFGEDEVSHGLGASALVWPRAGFPREVIVWAATSPALGSHNCDAWRVSLEECRRSAAGTSRRQDDRQLLEEPRQGHGESFACDSRETAGCVSPKSARMTSTT